jgi:LacI family transcriptional regulator
MARVTLQDVASRAGVSLATASKVMNHRGDVKDSTRQRVSSMATELGYTPRPRADVAAPARDPYVIALFHALDIPYSVQILAGIQQAATRAGVDVVVTSAEGVSGQPASATELLSGQWFHEAATKGCIAVLATTMTIEPCHGKYARTEGLPLIVIDPITPVSNPALDRNAVRISATNWAGARSATQHLTDLGHQRIGIITGPRTSLPSRERLEGYKTALESAGIPFDQALVRETPQYKFEYGHDAASDLLTSGAGPTAIFAFADTLALGSMRAAHEEGLAVPADLSIVSFDDTPLTTWCTPQLTAVNQPLLSMGQVAVERGLALAKDSERFSHPFQLETRLFVRESTAAPHGETSPEDPSAR